MMLISCLSVSQAGHLYWYIMHSSMKTQHVKQDWLTIQKTQLNYSGASIFECPIIQTVQDPFIPSIYIFGGKLPLHPSHGKGGTERQPGQTLDHSASFSPADERNMPCLSSIKFIDRISVIDIFLFCQEKWVVITPMKNDEENPQKESSENKKCIS